jgi:acetyl/propionyl-CoA carboxylase alpha subunit
VSARDERAVRRRQVDELLREIDVQRRHQLLLEAAGAYAPGLEREARQTRQQLAELVR